MTAEIKGAKELVSALADDATQVRFDENGYLAPEAVDAIRALLADHTRLEGENERLRNELDDALHDYGNAESEAKGAEADNEDLKAALAEARRQLAEQAEALKEIARMADEAVNNNGGIVTIRRCEDIADTARAAALLSSEPAGAKAEEGATAALAGLLKALDSEVVMLDMDRAITLAGLIDARRGPDLISTSRSALSPTPKEGA